MALLLTQSKIFNKKSRNMYRKSVEINFLVGVGFCFEQGPPNDYKMSSLDPRHTF